MDNFFLPLAERPKDLTDWESPLCVNRQLLLGTIEKLSNGETVQVPWYDFPNNRTGGYTPMEGSREAVIIAEGIHMLNPLLFDPIRDRATGIYVAPRTRIITPGDRIIHPEQVRVARRMIRNYQGRGNSLRETIIRAQSVNQGEQKYIAPNKPNASIHIDSFHDYELCILAKYLRQIPQFASDLDDAFIAEHGLTVLMDVVRSLPPLDTPYVPRDSIVREFVGGSIFQYKKTAPHAIACGAVRLSGNYLHCKSCRSVAGADIPLRHTDCLSDFWCRKSLPLLVTAESVL